MCNVFGLFSKIFIEVLNNTLWFGLNYSDLRSDILPHLKTLFYKFWAYLPWIFQYQEKLLIFNTHDLTGVFTPCLVGIVMLTLITGQATINLK